MGAELMTVFHSAVFCERKNYSVHKIDSLNLINLPQGPSAFFRVTGLKMDKNVIRHGHSSNEPPELFLSNFNTNLGCKVAQMLASLFHKKKRIRSNRVVTFHNQKDYIFFRHHRYCFTANENEKRKIISCTTPIINELGPRFTLKLLYLHDGCYNPKQNEFVFFRNSKEVNRHTTFL